jgi:hypothetical protein
VADLATNEKDGIETARAVVDSAREFPTVDRSSIWRLEYELGHGHGLVSGCRNSTTLRAAFTPIMDR